MSNKRHYLGLEVSLSLKKEIHQIAEDNGTTVSQLLNEMLEHYFKKGNAPRYSRIEEQIATIHTVLEVHLLYIKHIESVQRQSTINSDNSLKWLENQLQNQADNLAEIQDVLAELLGIHTTSIE